MCRLEPIWSTVPYVRFFFADLFGLKRRRTPRIGTRWYVDLKVPETPTYVGFFTRDVAVTGLRLEGDSEEAFRRHLSAEGRAGLRVRIPGRPGVIETEAELRWAMAAGDKFLTGWMFVDLEDEDAEALATYIDAHPELHLKQD